MQNLLGAAPERVKPWFYRTATSAEIDLLLEVPGGRLWVITIKPSLAPKLDRGFHHARDDLSPKRSFTVYSGNDQYPKARTLR